MIIAANWKNIYPWIQPTNDAIKSIFCFQPQFPYVTSLSDFETPSRTLKSTIWLLLSTVSQKQISIQRMQRFVCQKIELLLNALKIFRIFEIDSKIEFSAVLVCEQLLLNLSVHRMHDSTLKLVYFQFHFLAFLGNVHQVKQKLVHHDGINLFP